MAFGLEGERIRLVPIDEERHLENCYRWLNDVEVTGTLAIGHYPMTIAEEREYFRRPASETNLVMAIETLDGRHIGQSGMHDISHLHKSAKTGSFIGSAEDRGKGYGTEAVAIRSRYAFMTLGLRILYSEYFAGNEASRRMQEKNGYQTWGIKPAAEWKNGEFRDLVQTYLTKERWLELNS